MISRYVCIIYVSEGIKKDVLSKISDKSPIIHSFIDEIYNRTSFVLLGNTKHSIIDDALKICSRSYELISYSDHIGRHPSLGTVDNICFSPIGVDSDLTFVMEETRTFAHRLSNTCNIPVYLYGFASKSNIQLRDIRASLGYMNPPSQSSSESSRTGLYYGYQTINTLQTKRMESQPDIQSVDNHGKELVHGICCVGTVSYIRNLNIRFRSDDRANKKSVMEITKYVRQEGYVQALTLEHEGGTFEVACNLLKPSVVTIEMVTAKAQSKAEELGLTIIKSYSTGLSEEELLDRFQDDN